MMKQGGIWNYFFGVLFMLLVIAAAALLIPAWYNYREERFKEARLQAKLDSEKLEREKYNQRMLRLQNSPEEIEKVAREKYNYVKPGETVLKYTPGKIGK